MPTWVPSALRLHFHHSRRTTTDFYTRRSNELKTKDFRVSLLSIQHGVFNFIFYCGELPVTFIYSGKNLWIKEVKKTRDKHKLYLTLQPGKTLLHISWWVRSIHSYNFCLLANCPSSLSPPPLLYTVSSWPKAVSFFSLFIISYNFLWILREELPDIVTFHNCL